MLSTLVIAAVEHGFELVMPAWAFPLIAACVFTFMGFVVWSFRDVANRHSHKTDGASASGHATDH